MVKRSINSHTRYFHCNSNRCRSVNDKMNNPCVAVWLDVILVFISSEISTLIASECDVRPSERLIIMEGEASTLTCTASCQELRNVYFIRPAANPLEIINILEASMFNQIHGNVNLTNNTNCSYAVELHWTQDEQIRRELNLVKCVFIYDGRPTCETDTVSILFSDNQCANLTKIVPSDVLQIPRGGISTLSCTAPCTNGSGIRKVYYIRPGNGQDKGNLSILDDPAIGQHLSTVNFTSTTESCSYSVDISWTEDKTIQKQLDSLRCVIIYDGTGTYPGPCITADVLVRFGTGGDINNSSQPTVAAVSNSSQSGISRKISYCLIFIVIVINFEFANNP